MATVAPGPPVYAPADEHVRGVLSGMVAHIAEAVPETGEAAVRITPAAATVHSGLTNKKSLVRRMAAMGSMPGASASIWRF